MKTRAEEPSTSRDDGARRHYWIAVASAQHVRLGRAHGFMQVSHGKHRPLARVQPGDGVVYYSPTVSFGGADRLRIFTALGSVRSGGPYQTDLVGFRPFRRDVDWLPTVETPIEPLLHLLEFTLGKHNWGYQMRFGLFGIGASDDAGAAAVRNRYTTERLISASSSARVTGTRYSATHSSRSSAR